MRLIFALLPCVLGASIRGGSAGLPKKIPLSLDKNNTLGIDKQPKDNGITPVRKMGPRGSDPKDPMCLANTGFKCGDGKHNCQDWVACSEDTHTCTCHHWGCADSAGACRPIKNQWFPNDNRLMAIAAAKQGSPHRFVSMNASKNAPMLQDGWPEGEHPEAVWKFLIMSDNSSFLIATRQGQLKSDGRFLALPQAPWQDDLMIAPIQVKPEDALQASWRLVERPLSRAAFQHISSGRFLCYDGKTDGLSTCASEHCEADAVDFEIYPRISGIPMLSSEMTKLPSNSSRPQTVSKKGPASLHPNKDNSKPLPKNDTVNTSTPWYMDKK